MKHKFLVEPSYAVAHKRRLFDTLEEARAYNKKSKHKHPWMIQEVEETERGLKIIRTIE